MCGITGIVNYSSPVDPKVLEKMSDEIFYRGPDSSGKYISTNHNCVLGIRRLSIIDLKTGDQPIKNEDGSVIVVYNGEIYNYKALRRKLLKYGHKFRTESDTEVLVHLYEKYGESMAKHLNGMFAFAIWDEKKQKLILGRDRAGIKPLYFYHFPGGLVFGSETKAILKNSLYKKGLDLDSLSLYCYLGYLPADISMFKGIRKLLPGQTLSFSKSSLKTKKYFEIGTKTDVSDWNLNDLLRKSVVGQLQADVPVGVFLSGGLDSSLVSYYISESGKKLKSFSIGFEEASYDESKHARMVAKALGTEHYNETFSVNEVPTLFNKISKLLDEPLADASLFPTYKVSSFARKYVKVALSGDGGDELFGGYPTYQAQIIAEKLKYFPGFIFDLSMPFLDLLPTSHRNYPKKDLAKIFLKSIKNDISERQIFMMRNFFLGQNLMNKMPSPDWFKKVIPELGGIKSPSLSAQLIDFCTYMRDDFLFKTDRASSYNSLEVRVPYLDNDIITYAFSTKETHVNLLRTKILLRNLMREKLPNLPEIYNRPKKGFGIPLAKWFKADLKDFAYSQITTKKLENHIDKKRINKIWEDHQNMRSNNAGTIWMLTILSGWFENWN